jgi:predicted metal-dependent phosphoesterase TrpH
VTNGRKRKYLDLHIHSIYSDGTITIKEIVEHASTKSLSAISLTDHDCIVGVKEIAALADRIGLEVIPGVEISSMYENTDIHILGYFIDVNNANLISQLEEIRKIRIERAKQIVDRLNKKGIVLRFKRVLEFSKGFSIGRPHIAAALMAEEYVDTFTQAFEVYLGNHTEFFIPVLKLSPREAIQLIKEAGGLAVMAHPYATGRDDLLESFAKSGLDGLEIYTSKQPYAVFKKYRQFCHKYNLLETGGSDCHGPHYGEVTMGSVKVPYSVLDKMKKRKGI